MHSASDAAVADSDPATARPVDRYSAFLPWQKNSIIGLAALGGWFSSISSFIYFPAIPFLAADLHVNIQQVNLTVTSYLIMSGIFPSIMGDAADRFGRRPVFLVALIVYFGANIGLALQSHFVLLFVLRMVQSAGISGTFSIAYGVLGDLFTPAERGGYSGLISFLYAPSTPKPHLPRAMSESPSIGAKQCLQSQHSTQPGTRPQRPVTSALDLAIHLLASRRSFDALHSFHGSLPTRDGSKHCWQR